MTTHRKQRVEAFRRGVSVDELIARYPRLYHVSELGSWEGMRRHGLLSTTALLDLFEITGRTREDLESSHRPESRTIEHPAHGRAVLRDQKPMDDSGLRRALRDGLTPHDWYRLLNRHVFFWVDNSRVTRLLQARAYRSLRQTLVTVRTEDLLRQYSPRTVLSPLNTGATKPMPHPRGRDCFLPLDQYPLAEWDHKRRGKEPVVELSIEYGVPNLVDFVESVELVGRGEPAERIWPTG